VPLQPFPTGLVLGRRRSQLPPVVGKLTRELCELLL
jgi:hypothetical protein